MNKGIPGTTGEPRKKRFYHGTRADLRAGDLIGASKSSDVIERERSYVYLTANLDEAIWGSEITLGDSPGRVYIVEPIGQIGNVSDLPHWKSPGHPAMSCYSCEPLRVTGEVTEWSLYHGTRADLKPGDMIKPGHTPNFGDRLRRTRYVYLTRTLDAAIWGAELAAGNAPGRIYTVQPTGPIEEDPNLTNKKFRGNPTKSFRSREPLRVIGQITDWQGHSPEALKAMKEGLERLRQIGAELIED
jgi:rifampin ADP-ribosylating transferase